MCLHYDDDPLIPNTCQFLLDMFGFNSKPYTEYMGERYSIIWLAGFGTPDGFWLNSRGNKRTSWETLVTTYNTDALIVDACYSGRVFDYNIPKNKTVVSSTNAYSVSVNTKEEWTNGNYIASLASMFYCTLIGNGECKKYVGCTRNPDFQVCQMSMILHSFAEEIHRKAALRSVYYSPEYHPNFSIGTVLINGKPWKK